MLHLQNIRSKSSRYLVFTLRLTIVNSTIQPETRSLRNHEPTRSILHLPLEIQCEIFTHAHYDDSNNEASCLPVEVVLSHVCSKWRNIAINLPTLWTAFKFDTHFRVSDPVRKLEAYISRSGTQLLELYFSFSGSDYNHAADLHTPYELFASDFALVELPLPTPTVGIDSPSSLMTQPRHSISLTVFTKFMFLILNILQCAFRSLHIVQITEISTR